jgi:methionine-rich copper-binding protein CopC
MKFLMKTTLTLLAILSLAFVATPATAHSELEASTPAQGATVSHLEQFTLTFGEAIVPQYSKYTLTDSMGMTVELGTPTYDVTKTVVTVPVTGDLMAAKYAIGYAILSVDGHPISGKVSFTSTAVGPTPTPTPTPSPSPQPSPSGDSTLLANIGYAAAGLIGGAIIVVIITLVFRRRRKS